MPVRDHAWTLFCQRHGEEAPLPDWLVEAWDVDPLDQLKLQAAVQAHVDQAIAGTILLPAEAEYEQHRDLFMQAYGLGLKGCAVARASAAGEAVLAPPGERSGID
jgi:ribonucleoside-diphosphate reductase alpha chain